MQAKLEDVNKERTELQAAVTKLKAALSGQEFELKRLRDKEVRQKFDHWIAALVE